MHKKYMRKKYVVPGTIFISVLFIFSIISTGIARKSFALTRSSNLPTQGCPMAHCDLNMSDNDPMLVPTGNVTMQWHASGVGGELVGSGIGLGCSSNGTFAVCTYGSSSIASTQNMIAYDFNGNRLWNSGTESQLGRTAFASAPLIDVNGNVYVADNTQIVKYNSSGVVQWRSVFPVKALPISPVVTDNGVIVLATSGGPVFAYDMNTGKLLSQLYLKDKPSDSYYYQTVNTPTTVNNRVYISTQRTDSATIGGLAAIDVDPTSSQPLKQAWIYGFAGPSGASPLSVNSATGTAIYFDGSNIQPDGSALALVYGLFDPASHQTGPSLLFQKRAWNTPGKISASFAQDPRGGFWMFVSGTTYLQHRDFTTGNAITADNINLDTLVNDPSHTHVPGSAMSITGSPTDPIMLVSAYSTNGGIQYLTAVDLPSRTLLWKANTGGTGYINESAGQFPLIQKNGVTRVIFTTQGTGAQAVGSK